MHDKLEFLLTATLMNYHTPQHSTACPTCDAHYCHLRPPLLTTCSLHTQDAAVACGSTFWVQSKAVVNILTITSQRNTTECLQLQTAGVRDCARCGALQPGVDYTLYMAASDSTATTGTEALQVRGPGCRVFNLGQMPSHVTLTVLLLSIGRRSHWQMHQLKSTCTAFRC